MSNSPISRLWARWWYTWGLSLCHYSLRTSDHAGYAAGVSSFSRAIRLWPDFAAALYRRGLIRGRELGEYQAAIRDLERAGELRPDWPEPYLQRGLLHRFNGQPAAALGELSRYIELAPPGFWRDEAARQIDDIRRDST